MPPLPLRTVIIFRATISLVVKSLIQTPSRLALYSRKVLRILSGLQSASRVNRLVGRFRFDLILLQG